MKKMNSCIIVEDETSIYDTLFEILQLSGLNDIPFTTGEDAIAWVDDYDKGGYRSYRPHLALLDFRLPGKISGFDVAYRIRQSPVLNNIVVVIMTAYSLTEKEKQELMDYSGADLFLEKPLPPRKDFITQLNEQLAKRAKLKRA